MKERLKNLYESGELTPAKLLAAVAKGWVTVEDVVGIIGEDNATEVIRGAKIAEITGLLGRASGTNRSHVRLRIYLPDFFGAKGGSGQ